MQDALSSNKRCRYIRIREDGELRDGSVAFW